MRKLTAGGMTNKLKAKARVTLSALDMKKLILTNLPYLFIFLFADRASCLYRASPGADMGNKLLYAMEHADRILTGFLPSPLLHGCSGGCRDCGSCEDTGLAETGRCKKAPQRRGVWLCQVGNSGRHQTIYGI